MKTYSEYRAEAREALSGKWGEVALLSLVFVVISALITGATSAGSIVAQFGTIFTQMANITGLTFIGLIATFFVALPMQMGYQVIFLKVFRREGIDNYISSMFKIGYKSLGNVIVCSSAECFSQSSLSNTSIANAEYWTMLLNRITERDDAVTIEAKSLAGNALTITTGAARTLSIILCIVIPVLILSAGIVVYLRRRYQ